MVHIIVFNATQQSGENEGGDEQTLIVPPHTQARNISQVKVVNMVIELISRLES